MPHQSPPDSPRGWTRVTQLLGVDSAVSYAVATRMWQLFSSSLTGFLIFYCFSDVVTGYYVVFLSLLQLQTFVELGTQWAILYAASHEWAQLGLDEDGRITGDATALSRLASMTRLARNWFATAAVLFVVIAGSAGLAIFSQKAENVNWLAPWVSLMLLAGIGLVLSPYISLLEGCDQMATVNRFRLGQAVTGSFVVWSAMLLGAELWIAFVALGMQIAWESLLLARFRAFWQSLPAGGAVLPWRKEVWPLQWRLAVQSIFRYFAFGLFSTVTLIYDTTSVQAGRVGMTWMVLIALQQAAFAWVRTRTPTFGALVTRKQYKRLDRLFFRVTAVSTAVLLVALAAFCGAIWLINHWDHEWGRELSGRLLPTIPTITFSVAILVAHFPQCLGVYLRAHKRDPLLWLTVVANSIIGILVWQVGSRFGILPAAICFLTVLTLVTLPGTTWIWLRCRTEWHR